MRSRLQKQGMNVKNNWPSEGLLIWNQSAFIPKDAPNAEAAHRVINAMTGAEYGKKLTEVTEYLVTSKAGAEAFTSDAICYINQHPTNGDTYGDYAWRAAFCWPIQSDWR